MSETDAILEKRKEKRKAGFSLVHLLWIIPLIMVITIGLTLWLYHTYFYAKDFKPTELNVKEERQLDLKLHRLGYEPDTKYEENAPQETDEAWLRSEPYRELVEAREVSFSERELNAILARDSNLARRLAIDLDQDLVSARLLIPIDPGFPIMGGKTLRVSTGVELAFQDGRPLVILKGVSLMGVPLPNSWLGGLKNIDLIREYGDQEGFWSSFSEGVENIRVERGQIKIILAE